MTRMRSWISALSASMRRFIGLVRPKRWRRDLGVSSNSEPRCDRTDRDTVLVSPERLSNARQLDLDARKSAHERREADRLGPRSADGDGLRELQELPARRKRRRR